MTPLGAHLGTSCPYSLYMGLGLCISEISTKMRLASHTRLYFTHGCNSLESPLTYSIFHFVSKFALKLVTVPGAALVEVFWYLGFLSLSFSFASSSRSSKSTEPSVWNLDSKFLTVPGTALVEDLFISLLLCFSVLSRSAWFVQFVTRIMLVNSNDIK